MRLILAYKNFHAHKHVSHIGLGVAALNTSKTLLAQGITVDVWPIVDANELRQRLNLAQSANDPVTHVVVSAPWIPTANWRSLLTLFPRIQFAVSCHSNVGFLQADTNGVMLLRDAIDLEKGSLNFRVCANSEKFCAWITAAYAAPCQYLPNLYYMTGPPKQRPLWRAGHLRIGAFGATRAQKNLMSAVGAAVQISKDLKADTEIWLSAGRTEGGGDTILKAVTALVQNLPHVKLHFAGWSAWPEHLRNVANMHLLMQPSYTESFNMVTADGISEGVPSVVSDAIDWAPEHWKAKMDDVMDIARVGRGLLADANAATDGYNALQAHNVGGIRAWKQYLGVA